MSKSIKIIQLKSQTPYQEPNQIYANFAAAGQKNNSLIFTSKDKNQAISFIQTQAALRFEYTHTNSNNILKIFPLSDLGYHILKLLKAENISNHYAIQIPLKQNVLDSIRCITNIFVKENTFIPMQFPILFGFEFYNSIEDIPKPKANTMNTPDIVGWVPEMGFIANKVQNTTTAFINGLSVEQHTMQDTLDTNLHGLKECVKQDIHTCDGQSVKNNKVSVSISDEDFAKQVENIKCYITQGEAYQVVLSRQFTLVCSSAFSAYMHLLKDNPSPYHYYYNYNNLQIFGASPETSIKVRDRNIDIYPIAGTQSRGMDANGNIDPDKDMRQETKLRLDTKEMAEHMMLVDLARNDIAKTSIPGTSRVKSLTQVVKYSKVMHLYSVVTGQLEEHFDELNCFRACLNMGTLSGAPKRRATQILQKHEEQSRGFYGGAIGWISNFGECDTAIIIRSAVVKDGIAHIQAGAGIVYDSNPQSEAQETTQKAQAVIQAVKKSGGHYV